MSPLPDDCVMCREAAGVNTPLAYSDDLVSVFPARWQPPTNPGYALIVTRRHIRNLYELHDDEIAEFFVRVRDVARSVQEAFGATGTTIRQNNNPPGQEIDHLHVHIIPRFMDDDYWSTKPIEVHPHARAEQASALRSQLSAQHRWAAIN